MSKLPDPKHLPRHLREPFMQWRSSRSSAHRRFGHAAGLQGAHGASLAVQEATQAAITAWNEAGVAWWRAQGDVTRPDAGRLVLGADLVRRKLAPARKALEAARDAAEASRADVRSHLDRKLETPDATTAALDAELRAYLRGLDHTERGPLVRKDPRFAAAVARAPAELSGASEALHGEAKVAYLGAAAEDDMLALIDLDKAVKCARESLAALDGLPREVGCDFKRAEELAQASADAEAA